MPASFGEFPRRDHLGLEAILRKVPGIEGDNEIGLAFLGAKAKGIVLGIRRNLDGRTDSHFFGALSNQVHDSPDQFGTNMQTLQDFLVLVKNVLREEPDEIVFLCPPAKQICARILSWNTKLSEARDARDQHARVQDNARLALLSFRRQY